MAFEMEYDFETGVAPVEPSFAPTIEGDNDAQEQQTPQGQEDDKRKPFIDPRTGHIWGQFSEEEIQDNMANIASLATVFGVKEYEVADLEPVLQDQLAKDPIKAQDNAHLGELAKAKAQLGYYGANESFLWSKWMESKDDSYFADIDLQRQKMAELMQKYPQLEEDTNFFKGVALESSQFIGQTGAQAREAWKEKGFFAPVDYLTQPFRMMPGEIMGELYGYVDPVSGVEVDPKHAEAAAKKYGTAAALSEYAGILGLFFPAGRVVKLLSKLEVATGPAAEGMTEGLQTVIQNIAKMDAVNQTLMDQGLEPRAATEEELMEGVPDAALAGLQGALGIKGAQIGATKTYQGLKSVSKETRDNIQQKEVERTVEAEKIGQDIAKEADLETRQEQASERHIPVSEDNPITPEQRVEAQADNQVDKTDISDGEIDDFIIADEETQAEMAEGFAERTENVSFAETEFADELRTIVDEAEATTIEDILGARASVFGVSLGEYLEARGIQIIKQNDKLGKQGETASVTFTQEGQTIIRAFEKADVSSIVHEIGHIFRRDMASADLKIVEDFYGVKEGTWSVQQEEMFARAWEQYLRDGKAPDPKLTKTFAQLAQWMKKIYRKIKNSPIDVPINDDVRGTFDRLLAGDQQMKAELDSLKADQSLFQLQPKEQMDQVERAFKGVETAKERRDKLKKDMRAAKKKARATAEKDISRILGTSKEFLKALSDRDVYKMQLQALAKVARDMLDKGDKIGYAKAKADMKVVMAAQRANRVLRGRVKNTATKVEQYLRKQLPSPKEKSRRGRTARKPKSKFDTKGNQFVKALHSRVKAINKMGLDELQETAMLAALQKKDLFDSQNGEAFSDFDSVENEVTFWANTYVQLKAQSTDPASSKRFEDFYRALREKVALKRTDAPYAQTKALANDIVEGEISNIAGATQEQVEAELSGTTPEKAFKKNFHDDLKARRILKLIGHNTLGKYAVFGWNGLVKMITSYLPPDQQSNLRKAMDFFDARQKRNTWTREDKEAALSTYMEMYGIEDTPLGRARANSKISKDAKENIQIKGIKDPFSISGLRDLYLKSKDPSLENQLRKQGLPPEKIARIIRDNLTEADIAFADWQLGFYEERYDRYNQPYERINGVQLPKHENYTPLKIAGYREILQVDEGGTIVSQFMVDNVARSPESASALISRTDQDIRRGTIQFNDMANLMAYVDDMNHFAAYAEQVRLARAVLNNDTFQKTVKLRYGPRMLHHLNRTLNDIAANGKNQTGTNWYIDKFRTAFVTNMVAMNVGAMMKQFISVVNFYQNMTFQDYGAALGEFVGSPIKSVKEIMNMATKHEYFLNRRQSIERDLNAAMVTGEFKRFSLNPSFHNLLSLPVRIGDSGAIAIGGWAMVKKFQKQGMSFDEAVMEMGRQAEQTQQSGALEEQSSLQRGSSIERLVTPFSTGPIQALRQVMETAREFAAHPTPGNFRSFAKTFAIYWIAVPAMYHLAAEWLATDSDEEFDWEQYFDSLWPVAMAGPAGSSYELGRMSLNVLKRAMGHKYYQDEGMAEQLMHDIAGVVKDLSEGEEISADEVLGAMQAANILAGGKVPVKRVGRAVINASEGDVKGAVFGLNPER